jgi:hypothetical protein
VCAPLTTLDGQLARRVIGLYATMQSALFMRKKERRKNKARDVRPFFG